jgi:hypothetical protein
MAMAKKSAAKADMKQDAKVMKGMKPFQKAAFKKADAVMDKKKPSAKADAKMDMALKNKIMKKKGK